MEKFSLDDIDIKILNALQRQGRMSISDISEHLHISVSACHRRLSRLQSEHIIDRYLALINPSKVGLSMTFYVDVTLQEQSVSAFEAFENKVQIIDEILQCHLLAGQADYLLFIAARDAQDFSRIHQNRLAQLPHVAHMHSNLVIREVKAFKGFNLSDY